MDKSDFTTKSCTQCGILKPATLEFYHAHKKSKDGLRSACKKCRAEQNIKNGEIVKAKKREHYANNKQRICDSVKEYYKKNVEAQKEAGRKRHWKNRDHRLEKMRQYRAENLEEINSRKRVSSREFFKSRYKNDLGFTLKHRMRSLIRTTLKNGRSGKRMAEILGYSSDELKNHLESMFIDGMTWEKFMAGEIHIDHIVPISSFTIVSDECDDFKHCWALSNLRPLWAKDNLSKGAKQEFLL